MKKILAYNFPDNFTDIKDYEALYKTKRNSSFACVFVKDDGTFVALRDHLGVVPLYYRQTSAGTLWSMNYQDLIRPSDKLVPEEINNYLRLPLSLIHISEPTRPY